MTNLEKWRFYLKDYESPNLFLDWTFYFTIGAALQRRVWYGPKDHEIYPNQYLVFVGPPGVGKTMAAVRSSRMLGTFLMQRSKESKETIPSIPIAPDAATLPALTQFISNNCRRSYKTPHDNKLHIAYPLVLVSEELEVLLSKNSDDTVAFLLQAYDGRGYTKITKNNGSDMLPNVCVSMIAGTTESFMRKGQATNIISAGLLARTVFVWGAEKRFRKASLEITAEQERTLNEVARHVENLTRLIGKVEFSKEAEEYFTEWYELKFEATKVNKDPKLITYYERKKLHVRKLAMAVHFADNLDMVVGLPALKKAFDLLRITELDMHQALISMGRNPLHGISVKIYNVMGMPKYKEGVSMKTLRLLFNEEANAEELISCLEYLQSTGQISVPDNKPGFFVRAHRDETD